MNKAWISTVITFIQHNFRSPSHGKQRRKRNNKNPNWKGRNKTVTDEDDMILHIENPKHTTREILEPISELYKVAEYRINTQKSLIYLYTNNEIS